MCGICGFIEKDGGTEKSAAREQILSRMMAVLAHRGPDQGRSWISDRAALGFRRLSIIDLPGGAQPLVNETGDMVLLFNGEIYNYQMLRQELLDAGFGM